MIFTKIENLYILHLVRIYWSTSGAPSLVLSQTCGAGLSQVSRVPGKGVASWKKWTNTPAYLILPYPTYARMMLYAYDEIQHSVSCRIAFCSMDIFSFYVFGCLKIMDFVGHPTIRDPKNPMAMMSFCKKIMENHFKAYFEIPQDCIIKVELISASCLHMFHIHVHLYHISWKAPFNTISSITYITSHVSQSPRSARLKVGIGQPQKDFRCFCSDQHVRINEYTL